MFTSLTCSVESGRAVRERERKRVRAGRRDTRIGTICQLRIPLINVKQIDGTKSEYREQTYSPTAWNTLVCYFISDTDDIMSYIPQEFIKFHGQAFASKTILRNPRCFLLYADRM